MKIHSIVGTRPNFVKIAALEQAFRAYPQAVFKIIHTGQHYDPSLDAVFFRQLDIPKPDYHLGVGSDTPNRQLGKMLPALESVFQAEKPDWVLVAGDTTSALAGALAASKMGIPVAHVEAGLRSGDRAMPEEINRILTDHLSELLFVTEQAGFDNLLKENIVPGKIHFTGNCMIDTIVRCRKKAAASAALRGLGLTSKAYLLATLHRPSNVDTAGGLECVIRLLEAACGEIPVVFPLHPRTRKSLKTWGLEEALKTVKNLQLLEPQGYIEFLNLLENAALVLTDSGGIQDETTFLGVPCLTLRSSTERPVTVENGTNELMPAPDPEALRLKVRKALRGAWKTGSVPPLWDGQSGRRIAEILINLSPGSG